MENVQTKLREIVYIQTYDQIRMINRPIYIQIWNQIDAPVHQIIWERVNNQIYEQIEEVEL
jgi:hypothetical protein